MKTRTALLSAMTLTLLAPWTTAAETPEPQLSVYVSDSVDTSEEVLEGMRREVEEIYSPTGVSIVWLSERPADPANAHEARVYILEELPPSLRARMSTFKDSAPMAITLGPKFTEPTPDIYISRSAVLERASRRHPLAAKHMARALGRTLAHELAHRYLKSRHTDTGILRAIFTDQDLIDRSVADLDFSTDQVARLVEAARSKEER